MDYNDNISDITSDDSSDSGYTFNEELMEDEEPEYTEEDWIEWEMNLVPAI